MDKLDRLILNAIEDNFPLNPRPYDILAKKLKITKELLWKRVKKLYKTGVIRRIGVSLDSRKFGFKSTLAAISIPAKKVKKASKIIAQFPEITHSYLRRDVFNIWFTIIAADNKRITYILNQIQSQLSLEDSQILNLPAKRIFKLDARFSGNKKQTR
jgi:siroheme decarboxylase